MISGSCQGCDCYEEVPPPPNRKFISDEPSPRAGPPPSKGFLANCFFATVRNLGEFWYAKDAFQLVLELPIRIRIQRNGTPGADATATVPEVCKFDWFYKRIQRNVIVPMWLKNSWNSIGFISELNKFESSRCRAPLSLNSIGFISDLDIFHTAMTDHPIRWIPLVL